jgi:hypothetical protein
MSKNARLLNIIFNRGGTHFIFEQLVFVLELGDIASHLAKLGLLLQATLLCRLSILQEPKILNDVRDRKHIYAIQIKSRSKTDLKLTSSLFSSRHRGERR